MTEATPSWARIVGAAAPSPSRCARGAKPGRARAQPPARAAAVAATSPAAALPATATDGGVVAVPGSQPLFPALATLLAGHVLRDGEVVLLILKPSRWSILFDTLRTTAGVLIAVIAAVIWLPGKDAHWYVEAGTGVLVLRLMGAVLQWMGRLYVLTDLRVLRLSGVFTVNIFDCPLRRVAATRVIRTFRERLWRLGSIEITPRDEASPPGVWRTVRRPATVHEQIVAAVGRANHGV